MKWCTVAGSLCSFFLKRKSRKRKCELRGMSYMSKLQNITVVPNMWPTDQNYSKWCDNYLIHQNDLKGLCCLMSFCVLYSCRVLEEHYLISLCMAAAIYGQNDSKCLLTWLKPSWGMYLNGRILSWSYVNTIF